MPVQTEDQPRIQTVSECVPQIRAEDEDLSESSEDDDDEIKALYAKLPEDLGFTLVGMNFAECDFRTLKKLKMDLDTFVTLSEDELVELGLKESTKLQTMFSKLSPNDRIPACKSIFWKSKVKDLRISSEEALLMVTNTFSQIQELRKFLEGLNFTMSIDPPVNYMLSENHSSRDVFCNAVLRAGVLTKCVSQELSILIEKLQEDCWKKNKRSSEKSDKHEVVADREEEKCHSVEEEAEVITEMNSVGEVQSPRTSSNVPKYVLTVSISGALLFALWKVSKFLLQKPFPRT